MRNEMKKRLVVAALLVMLWVILMGVCGCGELIQAGGHVAKGIGDASTALGEHMTDTVGETD